LYFFNLHNVKKYLSIPNIFKEPGSMNKLLFSTDPYFRNLGAEWASKYFISVDIFISSRCYKVFFSGYMINRI